MHEQSRRLSEPLRWGRREKTIAAALLSCLALAAVGLVAFALASGAPARSGCLAMNFASTTGGAEVRACGSRARSICASGEFPSVAQELRVQCRRAGFPFRGG